MERVSSDTDIVIDGGRNDDEVDKPCDNTWSGSQHGLHEGNKEPQLPVMGMEFESYDDAYKFYSEYADGLGFGIRVRHSSFRKTSREKYNAVLCCSSQGFKQQKDTYCSRPETRTGCPAMMRIRLMDSRKWKVTEVMLEHNHIRIRKSNKNMGTGTKRKMTSSRDTTWQTNISQHTGGYENFTYAGTDVVNCVNQYKRLNVKDGDARTLYNYFCCMQLKSPNFFYLMDFNNKGQIGNVFWADGRSRAAYGHFGDVVLFDTTYLTQRYDVPLFIVVGVNHRGLLVLLGCGVLSDETNESFRWMLKAWLTCMLGRPPSVIITDQCSALQNAVAEVFPRASHCLSSWHIMQHISEELKQTHEYESIISDLNQVIYDSLRVEEFESAWENIMLRYNLKHHEWLQALYEDRKHWVPVFLKEIHLLGMLVTRENETRDPFFEGYIHKHTSLGEFLAHYEMVLQHKYEEEAKAVFESRNVDILLKTKCCFERQLSKVYSKQIFLKFQNEVEDMYNCFNTTQLYVDGPVITYIVKERVEGEGNNRVIREYEVVYNTAKVDVHCTCRLFYFKGYLCRHALSVLNHNGIEEIPSQYILSRWSKDVKRMFVSDHGSIYVNAHSPLHRYDNLYRRVSQIVEEGMISQEHYDVALHALESSLNKIRLVEHVETNMTTTQSNLSENINMVGLYQMEGIVHPSQAAFQSLVEQVYRTSQRTVIDQRRKSGNTEGTCIVNQRFRPIAPKPPHLGNLGQYNTIAMMYTNSRAPPFQPLMAPFPSIESIRPEQVHSKALHVSTASSEARPLQAPYSPTESIHPEQIHSKALHGSSVSVTSSEARPLQAPYPPTESIRPEGPHFGTLHVSPVSASLSEARPVQTPFPPKESILHEGRHFRSLSGSSVSPCLSEARPFEPPFLPTKPICPERLHFRSLQGSSVSEAKPLQAPFPLTESVCPERLHFRSLQGSYVSALSPAKIPDPSKKL